MDELDSYSRTVTPTYTVSRVIGWCANVVEQAAERKLIRPAAPYRGPAAPVPVPA